MQVGDITGHYYVGQIGCLRRFVGHIGPNCLVSELRTADLQDYRNKLLKRHSSAASINFHLAVMKAVFHWAKRNDILQNIPNIDTVKKVRVVHTEKPVFSAKDVKKLISTADTQMRPMIWLGLNCAFGCTDCGKLKWKDLDFENSRVKLARNKTGIVRNLPLWPETIEALRPIPRRGELVFYSKRGNPLVRVNTTTDDNGIVRYSRSESVGNRFSNLLKKTGIETEPGMGFYTLRRTAATLAANSGDPFAVQRLLGHTDVKMASIYVQNISGQTDRVINNSRKAIVEYSS